MGTSFEALMYITEISKFGLNFSVKCGLSKKQYMSISILMIYNSS